MLYAYLYVNENVFVYFSFNNIFFMFIDVNKIVFVHLQTERMNPLNLHNKGLFIFECYMLIFMLTKMFLFISLSIIFFYVHRREQDRVRLPLMSETEKKIQLLDWLT